MHITLNRRQFMGSAAGAVLSRVDAQSTSPWGGPVLDIHLHPRREEDGELNHINGSGATKAVLLTRSDMAEHSQAVVAKNPGRFVWFVGADMTKPDAIGVLRKNLAAGAIGLGEMKSHVACDGPEMRAVYSLAAEMNVPVLIHFADFPQFEGEGVWNGGIARFPAVVKANPKTVFIGHGDAFWANTSAEVPNGVPYPTGKIKPGGVSVRMLSEFPNFYGDFSANSGRNFLARDPDFAAKFIERHRAKLMFGCDCSCRDGHGAGQASKQPLIAGKCVARETLTALKQMTSPALFHQITWQNGTKLIKISS
jgi:predicted TIM-barrel fold metal-dependent hydrolase